MHIHALRACTCNNARAHTFTSLGTHVCGGSEQCCACMTLPHLPSVGGGQGVGASRRSSRACRQQRQTPLVACSKATACSKEAVSRSVHHTSTSKTGTFAAWPRQRTRRVWGPRRGTGVQPCMRVCMTLGRKLAQRGGAKMSRKIWDKSVDLGRSSHATCALVSIPAACHFSWTCPFSTPCNVRIYVFACVNS